MDGPEQAPQPIGLHVLRARAGIMFSGNTGTVVASGEPGIMSAPSFQLVDDIISVIKEQPSELFDPMRHDDMMPTHGMRNSAAVDALAARVSAGDAGGAEGSIIGQQGPSCRCCKMLCMCECVAADAYNCVWSHVRAASACPFRMLQWAMVAGSPSYGTGGSSVHCAACLLARNGSARACRTFEIWDRVCGTVSVTRRLRL